MGLVGCTAVLVILAAVWSSSTSQGPFKISKKTGEIKVPVWARTKLPAQKAKRLYDKGRKKRAAKREYMFKNNPQVRFYELRSATLLRLLRAGKITKLQIKELQNLWSSELLNNLKDRLMGFTNEWVRDRTTPSQIRSRLQRWLKFASSCTLCLGDWSTLIPFLKNVERRVRKNTVISRRLSARISIFKVLANLIVKKTPMKCDAKSVSSYCISSRSCLKIRRLPACSRSYCFFLPSQLCSIRTASGQQGSRKEFWKCGRCKPRSFFVRNRIKCPARDCEPLRRSGGGRGYVKRSETCTESAKFCAFCDSGEMLPAERCIRTMEDQSSQCCLCG